MNKIQVNPVIAIIIILVSILTCYGIYQGVGNLVDEAFYRGFNAGAEAQKLLDDQKQKQQQDEVKRPSDQNRTKKDVKILGI